MKIISIANIKGGSTKSTTLIQLSFLLPGKVLVIDMDPQGSTTDFFLPEASEEEIFKKSIWGVLTGESTLKESVWEGSPDIIPSTLDLAAMDVLSVRDSKSTGRLKKSLEKAKYDFILIDTPGSLSQSLLTSLIASDIVLIPVTPSRWTAKSVSMVLGEIETAKERGSAPKPYIIPAMFGKSKRDQEILARLQGTTIQALSRIPGDKTIQSRTEAGERLQEETQGYIAFKELAEEISKL